MNRCPCPVTTDILKITNEIWNLLSLNSPWNVGLTSYLIRQKEFSSFDDWKSYYYSSGEERFKILLALPIEIRTALMFRSEYCGKLIHSSLSKYAKLNKYYGRTSSELHYKASILQQAVKVHSNRLLSSEVVFKILEYRILGETWNGLYLRESNVVRKLRMIYKSVEISAVPADMDYDYGIDYIIHQDDKWLCALQIKPLSYRSNATYVQKAQSANSSKNQKFIEHHNRPVFTLLATESGDIEENKEYDSLKKHLDHTKSV